MRSRFLVATTLLTAGCHSAPSAPAPSQPTTAATTAAPTGVTYAYVVITAGRKEGEAELRVQPDGHRASHFTFNDRGRGPDLRETIEVDLNLEPTAYNLAGHDYLKAPVDEHLELSGGALRWKSEGEHGEAPAGSGFYIPHGGGFDAPAMLVRALRKAPGHKLKLLPGGEAWIEDDAARDFDIAGKKVTLHGVAVAGLGFAPARAYVDDQGELFAEVSPVTSIVRAGAEAALPALLADDDAWNAARAARLAHDLAHRPPAAGLAFTHARLFDSATKKVTDDATVIVVGDRITQVGNAKTKIPAGAQVIDAHGRLLMPGLWDMHVHVNDDGIQHLASGVTTVRDLGNDMKSLSERKARFDAGSELGPNVLRAGLIDGPGKFTAPIGVLASTPEEAIAAVDTIAAAGYQQVKMYSSLSPALVPVIAKAAHARHLRVSGHIPNGMRASEAIEAGYDEIQHVNFLFLQFLARPDDDTRTPARFIRVAEGAAGLDLKSPEVTRFFDLLIAHKTVLDPTLAVFHNMFTAEPGELDPVLLPFARRLPAQVERGARGGGLAAPGDKRARYRASYAAMQHLVKLAWERHIPIVPGTDYIAGLSLSHELELYVQAGIPAPDVLALATLGTARVMRRDRQAGSITVGKQADLVLVEGDPTRDITAIRRTSAVVCRGILYDPTELLAAVGMRAR